MTTLERPKFPKFMAHLTSKGLNAKILTDILNNQGYDYHYSNVLGKLSGRNRMYYEDIVIFSKVLEVDESIFFD